jgi:hypothetical protein
MQEATLDIKPDRMVHLGYGKYWRSDDIVGLCPIEENRGSGRRTEVYVTVREEPLVVSRSEESILRDMGTLPDGEFAAEEARALLGELLEDLHEVTPVLRRMLEHETRLNLDIWDRRIRALLQQSIRTDESEEQSQEDLFPPSE